MMIRDFNRGLQRASGSAIDIGEDREPAPVERSASEHPASKPDGFPALSPLKVFSNGVSDDRLLKASAPLADDKLGANEKLTRIDAPIPFPPTASSEDLGAMLGVTKQAIGKTDWWDQNRKGEKEVEIGRRRSKLKGRSADQESPRTNEDDG